MSTIKVEAQIDSTELVFTYTGGELEKPLRALEAHLRAEVTRLRREIGPGPKTAPSMRELTKPSLDAAKRQALAEAERDVFEAQLWAEECERKPDAIYRLTMPRLKWLYRQTRETT